MSIRADDEMIQELRDLLDSRASEGTEPTDEILKVVESLVFLVDDSDLKDTVNPHLPVLLLSLVQQTSLYRDLIDLPNS